MEVAGHYTTNYKLAFKEGNFENEIYKNGTPKIIPHSPSAWQSKHINYNNNL